MSNPLRTVIALSLIPNLGSRRSKTLLNAVPDPESIFRLKARDLLTIQGVGKTVAQSILSFKGWEEVDRVLSRADQLGVSLLPLDDPRYPVRLREIFDPPLLLWVKGNVDALSIPGIAVIGTRMPSVYGREMAERFSEGVAEAGLSVISGLAYGIDTIAHKTTVERKAPTIAVLGSGIDRIYPRTNAFLADQIVDTGGAVISEFPPGTKPDYMNFPVRNRVVSGLSVGVLVVETGITGGSMITARLAIDQNREVFVIPHPLTSTKGGGGHRLIREGTGKLVESVRDMLDELPWLTNGVRLETPQPRWKTAELTSELLQICTLLDTHGRLHIDTLQDHLQRSMPLLLTQLLTLECEGVIRQSAGKEFDLV